jgi:hypothetical protein
MAAGSRDNRRLAPFYNAGGLLESPRNADIGRDKNPVDTRSFTTMSTTTEPRQTTIEVRPLPPAGEHVEQATEPAVEQAPEPRRRRGILSYLAEGARYHVRSL